MRSMRSTEEQPFTAVAQDAIARAVAITGLGAIALIHLLDLPGKFDETPYMAWMYIGLIAGCVCLAGALWRSSDARIWTAAAALPISVLVGFTLSRTTGLPQADGDIGNWTESLGLASLFVEGALVALAGAVLATRASARALTELRQDVVGRDRTRPALADRSNATAA